MVDDWTRVSSDEFAALFNVTAFFRDPPAWDYVRDEVIPSMLAERGPNDPIRVRSVGCASGQKASSPKRGRSV
jgi:two-component system CheB/CheR fusion protein